MITKAIYPGSFDPFTNGHLDIIKKASALFSEVYVVIGINAKKQRAIPSDKMKEAIEHPSRITRSGSCPDAIPSVSCFS